MATFTGSLNANSVFASLYNMIISMQVFGTGISELSGIYAKRRVDGTLYGDKKLYLSTDVLKSYAWDGSDTPGGYNLLTQKRPPAPVQEYIEIDTYRQIPVTVDDYLTKQAFMDEGSFSQFNGVVLSWLNKTKEVYEHTKFTADIIVAGLAGAIALGGTLSLAAPSGVAGYDLIRWRGQELARQIEDRLKEHWIALERLGAGWMCSLLFATVARRSRAKLFVRVIVVCEKLCQIIDCLYHYFAHKTA